MIERIQAVWDSGNLAFLGNSAGMLVLTRFLAGEPLPEIVVRMDELEPLIVQSPDETSQQYWLLLRQTIASLREPASIPSEWQEQKISSPPGTSNEALYLSSWYAFRTWVAYFFVDIVTALSCADAQLPYEFAETGMTKPQIWFFDALTRLAAYPQCDPGRQKQLLQRVKIDRHKLHKSAQVIPESFQHKCDLVAAEYNRVLAKFIPAMELYDQAIAGAKTNGYLPEEALANELAAKFYLAWGKEKIAAVYLQEAYCCYARWGARAKTIDLEQSYPQLLAAMLQSLPQPVATSLDTLSTTAQPVEKSQMSHPVLDSFDQLARQEYQFMERTIRQSEARYQKLTRNIPGVIYEFKLAPDGCISFPYISSGCYELFHLTAAEIVANSQCLLDLIHPEDIAGFQRVVAESAQNMTPKLWEGRVVLPSGAVQWIKSASRPEPQLDGSIVWDGVLLDITDRKVAEIALVASNQFIQTVLDSFPLAIFWKDRNSVYQGCNRNFATLCGLKSSAEVIGKTDFEFPWDRMEAEGYRADDREVMETGQAKLEIIETQVQMDGSCIWKETNKVPLRNPQGEVIGVLGAYHDVSERQQAQIDLHLTNERLELTVQELQQATRLKDNFLATMSHELRTPLNAILGMSESLKEKVFGSLNTHQMNSISVIEQSGQHLLSLINDILDVSKIVAGKLNLQPTSASLAELCQSSLLLVKQQALAKQIRLDVYWPQDLNRIYVDERRMRQVLINLLNNAVKFTAKGGMVELAAWVEPNPDADQLEYDLCFAITDTGIGIANADLNKLFKPFVQIDSTLNRKYEGTGLGLMLVKQIVELHGGSVTIQSEVGVGSCFTVKVPQPDLVLNSNALEQPVLLGNDTGMAAVCDLINLSAEKRDRTELSPLILLAEDNEVNINTFSSYLLAKGYQILIANDGQQAVALAERHHPNLILMDIQMPDMDGLAAIACIRQQLQLTKIPIIALTALALPGDREKCLAMGADHYFTKPVSLKELHQTMQECLDLN